MNKSIFSTKSTLLYSAAFLGASLISFQSHAVPFTTTEISKYLVIATGDGTNGDNFESFNMSNVEIGADQEVVSSGQNSPQQVFQSFTSKPDLTGDYVPNDGANAAPSGNRWDDNDPDAPNDTVGVPDTLPGGPTLPGARPLFEGRDFSGNVALTGEFAEFGTSNSDVHADSNIGIQCNRASVSDCINVSSTNSFFDISAADPDNPENLNTGYGINAGFDPTSLTDELEDARDSIVSLGTELVLDENYANNFLTNNNIKDSGAPTILDLDAIDTNNDGIAVIDIDVDGSSFNINNTDWILQTTNDVFAIIRMADGTGFDFSNSSVMLGDGTNNSTDVIDELGAIFFMDAYKGTNTLFELSNTILGGVALWDLTDFNPNRNQLLSNAPSVFDPGFDEDNRTVINAGQNAQGCSQFISNQVLMSDARWNRCDFAEDDPGIEIPEPSTIAIFGFGLIAFGTVRRRALLK